MSSKWRKKINDLKETIEELKYLLQEEGVIICMYYKCVQVKTKSQRGWKRCGCCQFMTQPIDNIKASFACIQCGLPTMYQCEHCLQKLCMECV